MSPRALRYGFVIAIFVFAPLVLGHLFYGISPTPPRSSFSTSTVGHKAFYRLLGDLGYKLERFSRPLEEGSLESGVFVALEPGKLLFRKKGRYARVLKNWIAQGNSALITLGPETDTAAENDDREQRVAAWVKRAKETMVDLRGEHKEAPRFLKEEDKPSLRPNERPNTASRDSAGTSPDENLFAWLSASVTVGRLRNQKPDKPRALATKLSLDEKPRSELTRSRVFEKESQSALVLVDGRALVLEFRVGKGIVYLLAEPRVLQNQKIGKASHALLGVRLVEALSKHSKNTRIYFEEFSHGQTEARTLGALILHGHSPWLLGQLLLFALLWVWFRAARRRAPAEQTSASVRSRLQMLEGLARLYGFNQDRASIMEKLEHENTLWLKSRIDQSERGDWMRAVSHRTDKTVEDVVEILKRPVDVGPKSYLIYAQGLQALREQFLNGR
jgi:hypothetical protein